MAADLLPGLAIAAAVGSGLIAGLFFVFSICVMRALSELPDACGTAAMQAINRVIVNPVYLLAFMGTAALSAAVSVIVLGLLDDANPILAAGALAYVIGGFLVTIVFNVPMNDALADLDADAPDSAAVWQDYLVRWTRWNHVRTVACILASTLLILGLRG